MPTVQIKRDPFARASLERTRTGFGRHECRWCGRQMKVAYRYAWVSDAGYPGRGVSWSPTFCSVGCYRAYTGDDR